MSNAELVTCPDCVGGKITAGCAFDSPLISVDCGRCKGTGKVSLPTIELPFSLDDVRSKTSNAELPDRIWLSPKQAGVYAKGPEHPNHDPVDTVTFVRADLVSSAAPIDMLLFCPICWEQHVDEPESEGEYQARLSNAMPAEIAPRWTNPPHRSHLCHKCGTVWRPADVPTNGVAKISTAGSRDTWIACPAPAPSEAGLYEAGDIYEPTKNFWSRNGVVAAASEIAASYEVHKDRCHSNERYPSPPCDCEATEEITAIISKHCTTPASPSAGPEELK